MKSLLADLKVGARQFLKAPGSMALAVVAYAVGLGLVGLMLTLIFGVVRAHPPGVDFDEIQTLSWDESTRHMWKNGAQTGEIRFRDFNDLKAYQNVFDSFAGIRGTPSTIVIGNYAERFNGSYVTADFFRALTLQPQIGHFFAAGDDKPGAQRKVVLSDRVWRDRFAARESIVGESLIVNGESAVVIGVAGTNVDFPSTNDLWINDTTDPNTLGRAEGEPYLVLGQLKPGETIASATAALNTIAQRFAEAHPDTNTGYISLEFKPLSSIFLGDEIRRMFYLMFVCSLLVLLIACTNVANLTLSRATTRVKELAIRSSLGGSRSRLVRQMLMEGFSIALVGGLGGLIIAIWSSKAVWFWTASSEEANAPAWMNMDVDLHVIASLSVITLIASVAASIVPALKASRADVNEILKDNSRGSSGLKIGTFSKLLALFQLCVSCGLLITTSAMVSTAKDTAVYEPPYDPSRMMTARFDLAESTFKPEVRAAVLQRLQQRMESSPQLEGVGFTSAIDMIFNWNSRWEIRGEQRADEDEFIRARNEIVSDNFFEILGIPILYGRGFEGVDQGENAEQVCVINEPLAKRLWPDESPIGKQIRDVWADSHPWITVIGVVPDTKMAGPGPKTAEQLGGVYRPMSATPQNSVTVFAKTSGNPTEQAELIRSILRDEDRSIALYRVKTVQQAVDAANFGPLFFRNMFGLFGLAALALASIGIYGVMDFSVRQRFQEFGIRQALGAGKATIMKHVFRLGAIQISVGISLGVALGWALVSIIGQALGGITVGVFNYLVPIAVITGIAAVALFSPARQVTNANLGDCLRNE